MAMPDPATLKPMLRAFSDRPPTIPPIWLMRQAGRYLPEYRAVREQAGGFLDLCFAPKLAAEVTLQPIRRYGFDAAIIFSDILTIPWALGQALEFIEGEGPRLDPVRDAAGLLTLKAGADFGALEPVYEAIRLTAEALPAETALIGFAGAPWTLATYMVEGRGGGDFSNVVGFAERRPADFKMLIDLLIEAVSLHLLKQIDAGAEIVQLFDSWASAAPPDLFDALVIEPNRAIIDRVRAARPEAPIILFARGAGSRLGAVMERAGADGYGLDTTQSLGAVNEWPRAATLQGNLDPLALVAGGATMQAAVRDILRAMNGRRFVFNLGHGVVPQTPPAHVAALVAAVRAGGGDPQP